MRIFWGFRGRLPLAYGDLGELEIGLLDEADLAQSAELAGEPLREELWFRWSGRAGAWGPGEAAPGEGLNVRLMAIDGRPWRVVSLGATPLQTHTEGIGAGRNL